MQTTIRNALLRKQVDEKMSKLVCIFGRSKGVVLASPALQSLHVTYIQEILILDISDTMAWAYADERHK
jgi:hypothetical protein